MVTVTIGSIVEVARTGIVGAIAEAHTGGTPSWSILHRDGAGQLARVTATAAELVLVAQAPTFAPGDTVALPDGGTGDVVEDQGASIIVERRNRVPLAAGHHTWIGRITVDKPSLAVLNRKGNAP